jgi:hypothetical protein
VSTAPAMEQLQQRHQLAYTLNEYKVKNHYTMYVNNPTASHQNKKNFLSQKFIAGVVDTGDQSLLSNISSNFRKN